MRRSRSRTYGMTRRVSSPSRSKRNSMKRKLLKRNEMLYLVLRSQPRHRRDGSADFITGSSNFVTGSLSVTARSRSSRHAIPGRGLLPAAMPCALVHGEPLSPCGPWRTVARRARSCSHPNPESSRKSCRLLSRRTKYAAMHRYEEALESFRKGLAIMQGITPQAPSNTQWQADLATSFYKVGETLSMLRRYDEALEMSKKNVQLLAQLAQGDEVNSYWQHELSESYGVLGHALKDIGRVDDAVEAYRKALTVIDKLVASEPSNATWTSTLVTI